MPGASSRVAPRSIHGGFIPVPERARRANQALVWGTIATGVALGSHLAGGGPLPEWPGLTVPWVASVWICMLVAGARLPLARLILAVACSQAAFHHLFVLGTASGAHSAPPAGHTNASLQVAAPGLHHGGHSDLDMWAWHTVGASITIVVTRVGTRILKWISQLLATLVNWARRTFSAVVLIIVGVPIPRRMPRGEAFVAEMSPGWFPDSCPRRGPPWQLRA